MKWQKSLFYLTKGPKTTLQRPLKKIQNLSVTIEFLDPKNIGVDTKFIVLGRLEVELSSFYDK